MLKKLMFAARAAVGDTRAEGNLKRVQTKEKLWQEWNRSRGMFGWSGTHANLCQFTARYGMDITEADVDPNKKPSKDDLDKIFDTLASALLASGSVSFGG